MILVKKTVLILAFVVAVLLFSGVEVRASLYNPSALVHGGAEGLQYISDMPSRPSREERLEYFERLQAERGDTPPAATVNGGAPTMTEEEQQHRQRLQKRYSRWDEMRAERFGTPEAERIRQRIEERFGHLSDEERAAKLQELRHRRQALRQELEQLSPEDRKARMEELRQEFTRPKRNDANRVQD